jgi:hypothetical protein
MNLEGNSVRIWKIEIAGKNHTAEFCCVSDESSGCGFNLQIINSAVKWGSWKHSSRKEVKNEHDSSL